WCLASQNSGACDRMSRPKLDIDRAKIFVKFSGYSKEQLELFKSEIRSRPRRGILFAHSS
ncbi:hypothetical protein, partial [Candidatus Binatus sp.]|uniref:hypothetical protein n=1 Tax=Candidatus Binatus sp. TaxID=2811406 RepID=UPI003CB6A6AC